MQFIKEEAKYVCKYHLKVRNENLENLDFVFRKALTTTTWDRSQYISP